MSQRFAEYVRKERDDYPTPPWVTETVIPHLKPLNVSSTWSLLLARVGCVRARRIRSSFPRVCSSCGSTCAFSAGAAVH
jgi:hypothetical protein